MNIDQMKEKIKALSFTYEQKRKQVLEDFALSNNPFKTGDILEGDILEDHYQIVQVDKIGFNLRLNCIPECVYSGLRLTKQLKPYKSNVRTKIYQSDIKRKIK